jgi:hypothetical protein
MTSFRIPAWTVLALSMVAPSLRAADATRERVIAVVKKFAHSWETGDLAAKGVIPVDEGNVSFPYPAAAKNRW